MNFDNIKTKLGWKPVLCNPGPVSYTLLKDTEIPSMGCGGPFALDTSVVNESSITLPTPNSRSIYYEIAGLTAAGEMCARTVESFEVDVNGKRKTQNYITMLIIL